MSSNNPTSILASFSTMKSLVDAQQYQSPYQSDLKKYKSNGAEEGTSEE